MLIKSLEVSSEYTGDYRNVWSKFTVNMTNGENVKLYQKVLDACWNWKKTTFHNVKLVVLLLLFPVGIWV